MYRHMSSMSEAFADGGVVHVGEQQRIELLEVVVEGSFHDGGSAVGACLRTWHRLKLVLFRVGRAVADADVLKSARSQEVLQRIGMQGTDVRDIANVAREERE